MLVNLLPDQIANNWDELEYAIEASLPPIANEKDKMSNILDALLAGKMLCWVTIRDNKIKGVTTTRIIDDDITSIKSLLIFSIFAIKGSNEQDWAEAFDILRKYAKSKGCSRIIGYSEFDTVINRAKSFGADTKYTFITFDI